MTNIGSIGMDLLNKAPKKTHKFQGGYKASTWIKITDVNDICAAGESELTGRLRSAQYLVVCGSRNISFSVNV